MHLRRTLFRNCRVAARVEHLNGSDMWRGFLDRTLEQQLIYEFVEIDWNEAVVANFEGFDRLKQFIEAQFKKSIRLVEEQRISFCTISESDIADDRYITTTRSVDHFADLTVEVEPANDVNGINLKFDNSELVNPAVMEPQFANAIMDGLCQASLRTFHQPVVDLNVTVIEAIANPVDSTPSNFRIAARNALSKIIEQSTLQSLNLI